MEWISVNDKLPKSGVDVIGWRFFEDFWGVSIVYFEPSCGWCISDTSTQAETVTYWMSLPKSPNLTKK